MQFLTVSRRREAAGAPGEDLVHAEIRRARELYSEGHMRQVWHRVDGPGACVLWEAENQEHLWKMLESLPFYQAGLSEVTVVALRPYAGFGPEGTS